MRDLSFLDMLWVDMNTSEGRSEKSHGSGRTTWALDLLWCPVLCRPERVCDRWYSRKVAGPPLLSSASPTRLQLLYWLVCAVCATVDLAAAVLSPTGWAAVPCCEVRLCMGDIDAGTLGGEG